MAGLFLVLDLEGKEAFDVERVRKCLENMPGVYGWSKDSSLFCEFDFNEDSTIINMLDGSKCISIEESGDASLEIAMRIHRCYGSEIHAVDPECSFDIPLSTVLSLAEFNDKIEREVGGENLGPA